jgi:tetratricopeptide (TPR) repeat protein
LGALVDASLVVVEGDSNASGRYRFLETLREYALEKLGASGELTIARQRHAAYYLALATDSDTRRDFLGSLIQGRDFSEGLVRVGLVADYENFWAALLWFAEVGDWERCLHLIGALSHDWLAYGRLAEPRQWIETVLRHKDEVSPVTRGLALRGAGLMALYRGDHETALAAFDESLAIYRALRDGFGIGISLLDIALVLLRQGDLASVATEIDDTLRESRKAGDPGLILISLQLQGVLARRMGDLERAEQMYGQVLETLIQNSKGPGMRGDTMLRLAEVAEDQGRLDRACTLYEQALDLLREGDYKRSVPGALEALARVATGQGQFERAMKLAGAAMPLRERLGNFVPLIAPGEKSRLDEVLRAAREHLGEAGADAALAAGGTMSLDEVARAPG